LHRARSRQFQSEQRADANVGSILQRLIPNRIVRDLGSPGGSYQGMLDSIDRGFQPEFLLNGAPAIPANPFEKRFLTQELWDLLGAGCLGHRHRVQ
jgi:hypothetical protein